VDDEGVKASRVFSREGTAGELSIEPRPIGISPLSNGHARASVTGSTDLEPGNHDRPIFRRSSTDDQEEIDRSLQQRNLPYGYFVGTLGPRLTQGCSIASQPKMGTRNCNEGRFLETWTRVRCAQRYRWLRAKNQPRKTRLDPIAAAVVSPALLFDELE